jgi:hypothetical protein
LIVAPFLAERDSSRTSSPTGIITSRRCQRLLIADELLVTGIEAGDIAGASARDLTG